MNVCLVSPPYKSAVASTFGSSSPPLGLAYLASVLRKEHKVKIIDSAALNYTLEDLRRELKSFNPDIVGITSVTSSIYQA
ncbi:MAG TPA: B12-binding domain-containing radical SAM protein, partial [Candidatus Bathyarchaeota archaeon]|nr:B12-binding domain-containing radical SAM protein [Candidatus Bathyarchaeota archaeon]